MNARPQHLFDRRIASLLAERRQLRRATLRHHLLAFRTLLVTGASSSDLARLLRLLSSDISSIPPCEQCKPLRDIALVSPPLLAKLYFQREFHHLIHQRSVATSRTASLRAAVHLYNAQLFPVSRPLSTSLPRACFSPAPLRLPPAAFDRLVAAKRLVCLADRLNFQRRTYHPSTTLLDELYAPTAPCHTFVLSAPAKCPVSRNVAYGYASFRVDSTSQMHADALAYDSQSRRPNDADLCTQGTPILNFQTQTALAPTSYLSRVFAHFARRVPVDALAQPFVILLQRCDWKMTYFNSGSCDTCAMLNSTQRAAIETVYSIDSDGTLVNEQDA